MFKKDDVDVDVTSGLFEMHFIIDIVFVSCTEDVVDVIISGVDAIIFGEADGKGHEDNSQSVLRVTATKYI